jgi:hypothetical protein
VAEELVGLTYISITTPINTAPPEYSSLPGVESGRRGSAARIADINKNTNAQ